MSKVFLLIHTHSISKKKTQTLYPYFFLQHTLHEIHVTNSKIFFKHIIHTYIVGKHTFP
jgi:hypothetical protein